MLKKRAADNHDSATLVLFTGPDRELKQEAALWVGQQTGRPVKIISLSEWLDPYIGETEKNLNRLLKKAEHLNLILFFDEADALFGKRTATQNTHDRYANQEVSYLLQKLLQYKGLILLSVKAKTDLRQVVLSNVDGTVQFRTLILS